MLLHQFFLTPGASYLFVHVPLYLGLVAGLFILATIIKPIYEVFSAVRDGDYWYAVRLFIFIILFSLILGYITERIV